MYAVVVELQIKPGLMDAFLPLMMENARSSLRDEPGCHQFDVVAVEGAQDLVALYETYDDERAFQTHLASAHFQKFDAAIADMISGKSIRTGRVLA